MRPYRPPGKAEHLTDVGLWLWGILPRFGTDKACGFDMFAGVYNYRGQRARALFGVWRRQEWGYVAGRLSFIGWAAVLVVWSARVARWIRPPAAERHT